MGRPNASSYMKAFRSTFCRHDRPHGDDEVTDQPTDTDDDVAKDQVHEHHPGSPVNINGSGEGKPAGTLTDAEAGVKVYFLGLFETVNSVQTFDVPFYKTRKPPQITGTATHVRHAVAIDERRVKFKPALLAMDSSAAPETGETVKEVWFPGDHGDVGGSYFAENGQPEVKVKPSLWTRLKAWFGKKGHREKGAHADKRRDWFQLSDIPLKWMVDEIDATPGEVAWDKRCKTSFMKRFARNRQYAIRGRRHDILRFNRGGSVSEVIFWRLLGRSNTPSLLSTASAYS